MAGEAVRVEIRGLAQVTASLGRMEHDLADIAPPEAGQIIGSAAQARAPKRTGRLASSMSSSAGDGKVSVTFGVVYAGPINFGVGPRPGLRGPHNIRATRFLTGAVSDRESAWVETYKDAAQDAANRVKGA